LIDSVGGIRHLDLGDNGMIRFVEIRLTKVGLSALLPTKRAVLGVDR
jgi:hypothetical protein